MSDTSIQHPHYSMVIEWSDENQAFMVSIPEFPGNYTHGDTYEEAVKEGEDLIESLIMWTQQDGKPLPQPRAFAMR
ncbi:MAG TPA: type II toxin-antitoxin system HicB family antitoxin [Ktedonobacterales bacterium]|nr:type II toxin-antitoxin system HicB family antitoxin [Ktedonobacterales bacterium]